MPDPRVALTWEGPVALITIYRPDKLNALDLDMLAAAIREVRPTLTVIDPVNAYMGGVDTHRDADVRAVLAPLLDLIPRVRDGRDLLTGRSLGQD